MNGFLRYLSLAPVLATITVIVIAVLLSNFIYFVPDRLFVPAP
ncbi:MAG: photosystem I reaction center subunit IX [Leptolyngbyaceae cyanobacterium SL_5_9]|nr:photosystem I reaction center subunit IX [Leptolyngbyaceae cyanobacterium SL_5_9]NJO75814.1 photosystem I reaction center subunit IX [Leptolyngbyaceae cyanobacterium RM1_406_9]